MKTSNDSTLEMSQKADAREMLYGHTQHCIHNFDDEVSAADANRLLDEMMMQDPLLYPLVQRAQGRWLIRDGCLAFIPLAIGTHSPLPPELDEDVFGRPEILNGVLGLN